MAKTSASFTIMDYTDGVSLISGIESNRPLTSLYDSTTQTLNPSWATENLTLKPVVRKAGSAGEVTFTGGTPKWERRYSGGDWTAIDNSGEVMQSDNSLKVSKDYLTGDHWQVDYKFSATYRDPIVNLDFPIELTITLSRVANGTSFVVARAYAGDGNTFKNGSPESITITAELIRGTTHDDSEIGYQWQKSSTGAEYTDLPGETESTLVVNQNSVDSFASFRCIITDNDSASETHGEEFKTEGVSILDVSDPFQAVIESTAGGFFKNSVGSTILTCRVYRNEKEEDPDGKLFAYTWTMRDKEGAVASWNPSGVANGTIVATNKKSVAVTSSNVTVKSTFFCSVSDL